MEQAVATPASPELVQSLFGYIRPDEVAECWEGVCAVAGLYEALWACTANYKAPKPEVSEEPCVGMDSVADFWANFSPEHQAELLRLAQEEDERHRVWQAMENGDSGRGVCHP